MFDAHIQTLAEFEAETRALTRRPSRFGRLNWSDLDKPGAEHEYVVDGLISVNDKMIIGGPSMSGKSFLAIHVGLTIAQATIDPTVTVFGQQVMKPGLVVFQAGEGARGVKKRMRAWRKHFKISKDIDLPFVLLQSRVDLYAAEGDTKALIEEIADIQSDYPDLPLVGVFIDTLATAQGAADENSGRDMSAVMLNVDHIRTATGANVCLVHHVNAAGSKLRGHSSILANIDQVIMVSRDEKTKIRTAYLGKQKDDTDDLKFQFELMQVETGRVRARDGKIETSCVCLEVGEKEAARKAERASGFSLIKKEERSIFGALMKALDEFGHIATTEEEATGIPPGTKIVDYKNWRDVYAASNPDENGDPPSTKTIGQRFRQHNEALTRFGIIGLKTPWMWWAGKPVRGFDQTQGWANKKPIDYQSASNGYQSDANGGPTGDLGMPF
jgi:hypothetical protein